MAVNSRRKGAVAERQVANILQDAGLVARRGQQFRGGPDSPDVICESLPGLHLEVKSRQQHNIWQWMTQAATDMGKGETPIVWVTRPREPWLVVMRADDWVQWAKDRCE